MPPAWRSRQMMLNFGAIDYQAQVFVNGVSALKSGGAVYRYENRTISDEARRAIVPGANNVLAVHGHSNFDNQRVVSGVAEGC